MSSLTVTGDVLDGDVRVHAVLIQQVDRGHLQAGEHRVNNLTNVLGPAVDAIPRAIRIDPEPKLGRDHDTVAERRQRFAHEFFVRERAIGLRRVEEGHPALEGGANDPDGFLPVGGGTIHGLQAHAPVAQGRDFNSAVSESAFPLHRGSSLRDSVTTGRRPE